MFTCIIVMQASIPENLPPAALRTLVAIADFGGFTNAADALGLTQPTVSQQVKRIEQVLGLSLILRDRRHLEFTPAGQTLLDYARRIVTLNDEVVTKLTTPDITGALRLGLPHEFTISILPQLVGVFSQTHPGVVIEVECELSKTLLANITDYDLVIALHDRSEPAGKQLRREPLVWVSNPDYRFPSEPDAELQIIAAPDPCIYRDTLQRVLATAHRTWALRLTSSSYGAVCAAVSTGMGITVLARSAVPQDLRVVEHDLLPALPDIDLRLHCEWSSANSATRTFVNFVTERLTQRAGGSLPG
jgi:DNA-binding transcriptional LysR family regulator